MKRRYHYAGTFAAGAILASALAATLGAGRGAAPVFTERELAQATLDVRTAQAAAQEWGLRLTMVQRTVSDQKAGPADALSTVLTKVMLASEKAHVNVAVAKERVYAMREANGESSRPAKK